MGTTLGIWNHGTAAASSLTKALPMSGTTGTSGAGNSGDSSSTASATISSNDFLTLLVTEMRNQDPTANTDPNEYINQLVNVNSLEQLIDINQTLTADAGSTTSATGSSSSPSGQGIGSSAAAITSSGVAAYPTPKSADSPSATSSPGSNAANALQGAWTANSNLIGPGNLSLPQAQDRAHSIAEALNGRHATY